MKEDVKFCNSIACSGHKFLLSCYKIRPHFQLMKMNCACYLLNLENCDLTKILKTLTKCSNAVPILVYVMGQLIPILLI